MGLMIREIADAATELEKEKTEQDERDLPPEYCRYRDEGCEYARASRAAPTR